MFLMAITAWRVRHKSHLLLANQSHLTGDFPAMENLVKIFH